LAGDAGADRVHRGGEERGDAAWLHSGLECDTYAGVAARLDERDEEECSDDEGSLR